MLGSNQPARKKNIKNNGKLEREKGLEKKQVKIAPVWVATDQLICFSENTLKFYDSKQRAFH